MSADLIVPFLLVVGAVVALGRGGGNSLRAFVDEREARRVPLPPARPRISGDAHRSFVPFDLRPRAIEWVDAEIVDDLPALPGGLPVIDVDARDVEPITPPTRRAIEPRRKAIGR